MPVGVTTTKWQGITGAPGYTSLSFDGVSEDPESAAGMIAATIAFMDPLCDLLGTTTTLSIEPEVRFYDTATGDLEAIAAISPAPAELTGGFGAQGPGPCGAVVSWTTAGINRGRPVRGRTYAVPLAAGCYQADGSLTSGTVTQLGACAAALAGDPDATFGIWSRPRLGAGGAFFPVTSWSVPDMAAVLRSRRD